MTACLYISPGTFPWLLSDIIVTTTGSNQMTPRPIGAASGERTILHARKTFIINQNLALACAGNLENILRCLDDIEANLEVILSSRTPIDQIGKFADSYGDIRLIGAYSSRGIVNCFYNPRASYAADLDVFGVTYASGTGAESLIRKLKVRNTELLQVKRRFYEEFSIDDVIASGQITVTGPIDESARTFVADSLFSYELGRNELARINLSYLVAELNGLIRPSFGGFFEAAFWSSADDAWIRQYPALYMIFEIVKRPHGHLVRRVGPAILYEPGIDYGEILAVDNTGRIKSHITADPRLSGRGHSITSLIGPGWAPRYAHIGFVRRVNSQFRFLGAETTSDAERQHIHVEVGVKNDGDWTLSLGISDDWLRKTVSRS